MKYICLESCRTHFMVRTKCFNRRTGLQEQKHRFKDELSMVANVVAIMLSSHTPGKVADIKIFKERENIQSAFLERTVKEICSPGTKVNIVLLARKLYMRRHVCFLTCLCFSRQKI